MSTMNFTTQTSDDFNKAKSKAIVNEIQHFLKPEEAKLISFYDLKELLHPDNETYIGMKTVPVASIVGSEGRYNDFDNMFFPKKSHLKNRWESIDRAHLQNTILPPINLYEIGGLYFVRDGNHRVSVARARGIEFIDAEVTSLRTEIRLKPGYTIQYLLKQIIQYEKRVVYSETAYGDITDDWSLDFTTPGQYDVIYNHILTHKYYLNLSHTEEISMPDAIISWYNMVYTPVLATIRRHKMMVKFRRRTPSDLFVWLVKYWEDFKAKYGEDTPLDSVIDDFESEYGDSFIGKIAKIKNLIKSIKLRKNTHANKNKT
ncbi:MAG: transcriptional regulator [Treponemataceae bacterium]|nr:transcriptional regulator [Treponemataceae bacterium]